jgi:hypothetical protein
MQAFSASIADFGSDATTRLSRLTRNHIKLQLRNIRGVPGQAGRVPQAFHRLDSLAFELRRRCRLAGRKNGVRHRFPPSSGAPALHRVALKWDGEFPDPISPESPSRPRTCKFCPVGFGPYSGTQRLSPARTSPSSGKPDCCGQPM